MIKNEFENLCFNEKGNQQKNKDITKSDGKNCTSLLFMQRKQTQAF